MVAIAHRSMYDDTRLVLLTFQASLPRHAYLPVIIDSLRECLKINSPREELWFSASDVPLKWYVTRSHSPHYLRNFPVGVLYDVFGNGALPWRLTVHVQDFPTAVLLRCPDELTLKSFFWNSLKQVLPAYFYYLSRRRML